MHFKCFPSQCDFERFPPKIAYVSGATCTHLGNTQSWKYASARAHVTPNGFNALNIW